MRKRGNQPKFFSEFEISGIIDMYSLKQFTIKDIAKKFNICGELISRVLKEHNIDTSTKGQRKRIKAKPKFDSLELDKIITLIKEGKSIEDMTQTFVVGRSVIDKFLRKHKIDYCLLRSGLDENYFEEINTHKKAYILGFLYADGTNNKTLKGAGIAIAEGDINFLEMIRDEVCPRSKIHIIKRSSDAKSKNTQNTASLFFSSAKMSTDLLKLGCMPNKTKILQFPTNDQVPKDFLPSFVRGYFDGDGCIGKGKRGRQEYYFSNMVGGSIFMRGMFSHLTNNQISARLHEHNRYSFLFGTVAFSTQALYKFYKYIYQFYPEFSLKRKRDKFISFEKFYHKKQQEKEKYLFEYKGEKKSIPEWGKDERCVVTYNTLTQRIFKYKWTLEKALFTLPHFGK